MGAAKDNNQARLITFYSGVTTTQAVDDINLALAEATSAEMKDVQIQFGLQLQGRGLVIIGALHKWENKS